MITLKLWSRGIHVNTLQHNLNKLGYSIVEDGIFGKVTEDTVKDFQMKNRLTVDGIVGKRTWERIFSKLKTNTNMLSEKDFEECAVSLNVDTAAVKAVQKVETAGRGGFLDNGLPPILFEGHIFWSQLKKEGIDPESVRNGNEDIVYPKWTKEFYKGGEREYERLERAKSINEDAALKSASFGMFQIMGMNHKYCGCDTVQEFVELNNTSEGEQLKLFCKFIEANPSMHNALKEHDWAKFAKLYNGPAYAQNKYDIKLEEAYNEFV